MTMILPSPQARPRSPGREWAQAALVLVAIGAIAIARLAATRAGLPALAVGAAFGAALGGIVLASGARVRVGARPPASLFAGAACGLGLAAIVIAARELGGVSLPSGLARPAAPFGPWALVTIVVAVAEEAVLRGLLFDLVHRAGGSVVALLTTSVVFALLHVPLYGWHVVPLDLAVGVALGGLRIATRGIVAPAVAHAVADLATWGL